MKKAKENVDHLPLNARHRISIVLGGAVMDELKKMMAEDHSTDFTAFFTFLIFREMKRRLLDKRKTK